MSDNPADLEPYSAAAVGPGPAGPSSHPGAVKARRWRACKAAERRGAVPVTLTVEPGEVADLCRLGLLAGDPYDLRRSPPSPAAVEAALRRLLATAGPLAEVAWALWPEDATDGA